MKHSLLIYLCLFILQTGFAEAQQYRFYNSNNGLSSARITSIYQDNGGFIWVATEDGLNRFDGNTFTVYRHIPDDSASLDNNYIRSMYEDSKHRFWVITLTGLFLYDQCTDRFIPYKVYSYDGTREFANFFYLTEDSEGYIWVSVSGNGVVRLDTGKGNNLYFNTMNSDICSNHINDIYEDRFGNIWFGSGQNGISIYNPSSQTFRTYQYQGNGQISSNNISSICDDHDGNVWVGTFTGGINKYSFNDQSFSQFNYSPDGTVNEIGCLLKDRQDNIWIGKVGHGVDVYSTKEKKLLKKNISISTVDISRSKVQCLYEDRQGNIWMGLFEKGLVMISSEKTFLTAYRHNPYAISRTIKSGPVQPVFCDSHSELWVGVGGSNLYVFDRDRNIKKLYTPKEHPLLKNIICIYEDKEENIWLGTYLSGAIRYNRKKDRFDMNLNNDHSPVSLLSNHIKAFVQDKNGKLWIATNGGGLNVYDPATGKMEYVVRYEANVNKNQLISNWCNTLLFDKDGLCWIATFHGLCTYDQQNNSFEYYTMNNGKVSNNIILSLLEDSKGNMWIGTNDGLTFIEYKTHNVKMFDTKDGLPNSVINGIEEDREGNLWMSTNKGIAMYDPQDRIFTTYSTADGLLTDEMNKSAFFKTQNDEFLIGSIEELITFFPENRKYGQAEPLDVVLTDLYIFNEIVHVESDNKAVLTKTINNTKEVRFSHMQNSFSLEFSALEYTYPEKIHYEVMMKGFDKTWQKTKNNRVTYTNLNPGNYQFVVRAWTTGKENALTKTLDIEIIPPLWATVWAKISYLIILLLLGYFIYMYISQRVRSKRNKQLSIAKLQFFSDISHEIRTPLTLILSPLEKLINNNREISLLQTYNTMYKNGTRLLQLVNQIIDIQALEYKKRKLAVSKINITVFTRDLKNSFNLLSEDKNLQYDFESVPEDIAGYVDTEILSAILFNLISNAFKYTASGTVSVKISISEENNSLLFFTVSDTGKGIPEDQQKLIFDRFYMIEPTSNDINKTSSGIGLHLTRKLVDLHHGKMQLTSTEGKGSTFHVAIPYLKEAYKENEILSTKEYTDNVPSKDKQVFTENISVIKKPYSAKNETILLVEDNSDIRRLLSSELSSRYNIIEAVNGKDGLLIAMEKNPDFIICDIMMPEMDGIELCTKIRNNKKTSSIPLIMLTAKSSLEQQIKGLKSGADAYITKPFNIEYLKVTISRLSSRHQSIKNQLTENKEEVITIESSDSKTLKKLNSLINDHIDNLDLGVEFLCKELGLSKTHLNRKVRELTGYSPASYIRQLRLNKASQLLKVEHLTIAEIAYMTGFSSPSYFSQTFRDYYGVTPKEYSEVASAQSAK
jgi:ligand-binding sensor domain-containing protein/signal transduction histidine kinase/AraC-like DNA-binding protein